MASKAIIKLKSSDGESFEVDLKAARMSETIKEMLDLGVGEDDDDDRGEEAESEVLLLQHVRAEILQKVILWANYHKDKEVDEAKETSLEDIDSWDSEFLKVDKPVLLELILAANYLDIKGLLNLTCKAVALMIKGKKPEEMKTIFNIVSDFGAGELENIIKENEWCEEK